MSHHTFYIGDVLDVLQKMPDESVNCVVTSPPYWGLRDYGVAGQIGLESTPEEYVAKMVEVFREVRRVLRADGTLWLNLGDSYSAHAGQRKITDIAGIKQQSNVASINAPSRCVTYLGAKQLVGVPWRMSFALQEDGYYLRQDIIWSKPNCMPESVTDRPTKAHEYVFLLTKSERYWYDAEAIKEPATVHLTDKRYGPGAGGREREAEGWNQNGPYKPHKGFKSLDCSAGRNCRSVWTIQTEGFPGAHFAVMPTALAEKCILAGCPAQTCPVCGAPWERVIERVQLEQKERKKVPSSICRIHAPELGYGGGVPKSEHIAVGWQPTCSCPGNDGSGRGIVLDPFGGAGTVTLVAMKHERSSVYIDLNPAYCEMALKRCDFGPSLIDCHTFEVVDLSKVEAVE